VATLGTALSADHIRMLTRIAGHLVLVYDSDDAGIRSAKRCVDLFWAEHVDFRRGDVHREEAADTHILILPEGHDPDSFVFQFGAEEFRRLAQVDKKSILSFLIEMAVRAHGLTTEGKIRIVSDLHSPLAAINDSVAQALYVQKLAERIGVSENTILTKIQENASTPSRLQTGRSADGRQPSPATVEPSERAEQRILAMMLQFPAIIPEIVNRNLVKLFMNADLKACADAIIKFGLNSPEQLPELLDQMPDGALKRRIASLAIGEEEWSRKGCSKLLTHFIEIRQKQDSGFLIQKAIEAAERDQNEAEVLRLLSEKQKMAVQREKRKMSVLREK
jgi:DNA primase